MQTSSGDAEKRYRVLLVDDDPRVLDTLQAVLGDDADVVTCTSAERALSLLESGSFHVVSTDFKMPQMNGVELLQKVAALPFPVGCLLVTGADEYIRTRGPSPYYVLLKPVDPTRLISMVMQLARITEMKRSVGSLGALGSRPPSSAPPMLPSESPPSSRTTASRSAAPPSAEERLKRRG